MPTVESFVKVPICTHFVEAQEGATLFTALLPVRLSPHQFDPEACAPIIYSPHGDPAPGYSQLHNDLERLPASWFTLLVLNLRQACGFGSLAGVGQKPTEQRGCCGAAKGCCCLIFILTLLI